MKRILLFVFTLSTLGLYAQDATFYFGKVTSSQLGYDVELWMNNTKKVGSLNIKFVSDNPGFVLLGASGGTGSAGNMVTRTDPIGEMSVGSMIDSETIPVGDTILTTLIMTIPNGASVCIREPLGYDDMSSNLQTAIGDDSCVVVTNIANQLVVNTTIEAYPNPSVDGNFTLNNLFGAAYEVYDVLGNKVLNVAEGNSMQASLDLSAQAKGMYFVRVLRKEGVQTLRLHYQ